MDRMVRLLKEGTEQMGLLINEEQTDRMMRYMGMLVEWNAKFNLTSITDKQDIVTKHFLDSLTCAATGYVHNRHRAIDVGTGAGFPGIPLKIVYPGMEITLLDSLNKRIEFLKYVAVRLGLEGSEPLHGRAEDMARSPVHREKYDVCFSRAVAHLSVVGEYCLPFVKVGGVFLAMKGPGYLEEIKEADKAVHILGGEIADTREFRLPFTDINHYIIIIRKQRATGSEYPRKAGRPTKKPLR